MDTKVTYIGFDEFAQALGVEASTIQKTFETAARNTALAIRREAQIKVPKRSYTLMDSIIAEPIPTGAQVSVMELYGTYVEFGTGLYGPKHQRIVPKSAKVMAWRASTGQMVFAASTKGQKAQPFFMPAVDDNMVTLAQELKIGLDTVVAELAAGK